MNVKGHFRDLGMLLDKKYEENHTKIDLKLLQKFKSRGAEQDFLDACEAIKNGSPVINPLLLGVQNINEYALLQSHDSEINILTYNHIFKLIKHLNPQSIIDIGCGGGFLPYLLSKEYPDISYVGVDYLENLLDISKALNPNREFCQFDYLSGEANFENNAKCIIANRPFSLSDLPIEVKPHITEEADGVGYCINCAESLKDALYCYMSNICRAAPKAEYFIQIQRLPLVQDYIGFIDGFERSNWHLSKKYSRILKAKRADEMLGALVFTKKKSDFMEPSSVIQWMKKNGWRRF